MWFIITSSIHYAQTTVNPDISAIGTFNMFTNNIKGTPEYGKLNFDIPAMELFVEGYLNPYARATFNVAYEEGEFSAEEIYAQIVRGLPLDIQIKAGKYLLGFGKINTVHPHAWLFIYRPLYQQIYFSPEGFNDIGLNFSFIIPTGDLYTTLDLGVFKGDAIANSLLEEGSAISPSELRGNSPIFVGRLGSFFSLGDFHNLEVGLSNSFGVYATSNLNAVGDSTLPQVMNPLYYSYTGIDFKYKYRPDSYTALVIQGEGLWNYRDVLRQTNGNSSSAIGIEETISTFGYFLYLDYRFDKIFSIGAKYDFTYGIPGDEPSFNTLGNDNQNKTTGIEGWIGYYPIEETLVLRLGLQHLMYHLADATGIDSETTINLQLIFSLGPHKAHPF